MILDTSLLFEKIVLVLQNAEVVFNNMPHLIRKPAEGPFGRLKARWKRSIALQLENVPAAIFLSLLYVISVVLIHLAEYKTHQYA